MMVYLDASKNMMNGRIESKFKSLCLIETTGLFASDPDHPTHIRDGNEIDAV